MRFGRTSSGPIRRSGQSGQSRRRMTGRTAATRTRTRTRRHRPRPGRLLRRTSAPPRGAGRRSTGSVPTVWAAASGTPTPRRTVRTPGEEHPAQKAQKAQKGPSLRPRRRRSCREEPAQKAQKAQKVPRARAAPAPDVPASTRRPGRCWNSFGPHPPCRRRCAAWPRRSWPSCSNGASSRSPPPAPNGRRPGPPMRNASIAARSMALSRTWAANRPALSRPRLTWRSFPMTPPRPIDLSRLHWSGDRTRCPTCGGRTAVLLVLADGRLRCPSCARTASP
jgi:hypothetical protein